MVSVKLSSLQCSPRVSRPWPLGLWPPALSRVSGPRSPLSWTSQYMDVNSNPRPLYTPTCANHCEAVLLSHHKCGALYKLPTPEVQHHPELPPKPPHTCDPCECTSVRGASRGSRMPRVQRHQLVRHTNSPLLVVDSGMAFALRMCVLDYNLVEKTAYGVHTTNMDTVLPMSRCPTAKSKFMARHKESLQLQLLPEHVY